MSAARTFRSSPFGTPGISTQSLGIPAAAYPGRIATNSDLIVAVDRQQTTLLLPLAIGAASMTVLDASMISSSNLLSIDNEIVKTTGPPAGNVVPISRGFDGTAPAAHLANALVSGLIDAYHHNGLVAEVEAIETALGPNLSNTLSNPTTTLGDLLVRGPSVVGRLGVGAPGTVLTANAGAPLGVDWEIPPPPLVLNAASYNFTPQTPGGSLVAGNNSITLSPVPNGVNGTDASHYLYISGGTGAPEAVLITGGSAIGGSPSGSLIVQCANSHSGAWTIQSATGGIQEAIIALPPAPTQTIQSGYIENSDTHGGVVYVPNGLWLCYAPITMFGHTQLIGSGTGSIVRAAVPLTKGVITTSLGSFYITLQNIQIDLNNQAGTIGLRLVNTGAGVYSNINITGGTSMTTGVGVELATVWVVGAASHVITVWNRFTHIHIENGPQTGIHLIGQVNPSDSTQWIPVTLNSFEHVRVTASEITGHSGPVIFAEAYTDSNWFRDIDVSAGKGPGIQIGGAANTGVGNFSFTDVYVEIADPTQQCVFLGVSDNTRIDNLVSFGGQLLGAVSAAATYSITNSYQDGTFTSEFPKLVGNLSSNPFVLGGGINVPTALVTSGCDINLVSGANQNVSLTSGNSIGASVLPYNSSYCRVNSGPTASFSIGGFVAGLDGQILRFFNALGQTMTINNQDPGSAVGNRITTLTGTNVVLRANAPSFASFIYSAPEQAWILTGTN